MRKKLFVHIGQSKTGSTSLQRFLHVNRAALADRGVFYPPGANGVVGEEGGHNHHHLVLALREARPHLNGAAAAWKALVSSIERSAAPVAVISCELLWPLFVGRAGRLRAVQWMAHMLAGFDVRIVCYLRPQDAWVEAMYNQLVKSGQTRSATQSFAAFLQRPQTGSLLDYAGMLEPWAQAFGQQAVLVRSFERAQLVAGDVIDDFMSLLGEDELEGLTRLPESQQRVSWPVCELLAAFNRDASLNEFREAFIQAVSVGVEADPRARLLDAAAIEAMQSQHEAGNARVAQTYCGRPALFDPLEEAADRPVYQGLSTAETAVLLVKVFAAQQRGAPK